MGFLLRPLGEQAVERRPYLLGMRQEKVRQHDRGDADDQHVRDAEHEVAGAGDRGVEQRRDLGGGAAFDI